MAVYESTEIAAEIKGITRTSHASVEAKLGKFLFSPMLSLNEYKAIIRTFYEIHSRLEPLLKLYLSSTQLMVDRSKLALLEKDLLNLSNAAHLKSRPDPCHFEAKIEAKLKSKTEPAIEAKIDHFASALGALYVVEGSTLGGNIIAKRLKSHSWMKEAYLNYFTSYGSLRAEMWKSFLLALSDYDSAEPHNRQLIITGALNAFEIFETEFASLENTPSEPDLSLVPVECADPI